MKVIEYTNRLNLRFADIWFCNDLSDIKTDFDILNIKGYPSKVRNGKCFLQHSLLIDLLEDINKMEEKMKKRYLKKLMVLILVLGALANTSACSPKKNNNDTASSYAEEKETNNTLGNKTTENVNNEETGYSDVINYRTT